ncbi:hypothetical protein IL252_10010 [Halomicrobium sp. IBSBa]|uniref:hypothetical protein n=1 Tax=Halomicrobium sp. IBSBa TaxID=2778916 RepID=UPI001ABFF774|nr:hypothetical protein [Halomicrobium sp. IBSBa]MBO4248147.1 hypothetical protein [Halomicrobium sp. IBSBa]
MDADSITSATEERADGASFDWEAAGRTIVESELDRVQEQVASEFSRVARRAACGDEITRKDIRDLRYALQQAEYAIEALESAENQ